LPPPEERDGSRAQAAAADKDDWVAVTSADGHVYWVPPEVAYLVADGMPWQTLEATLRPALAARTASPGSRRTHTMSPITQAVAAALVAYCVVHPPKPDMKYLTLAKRATAHARARGYKDCELLPDPEDSRLMRDIAKDALFNLERDQKRRSHRH
jgi:hypothetical protein